MYSFKDIRKEIEQRLKNKEMGYYNCIPFSLERFTSFVPGIIPKEYYLITGNTAAGKSKFTRHLFIHEPFQYVRSHPELNIKLDILYWSLEEDREKVYVTELSRLIRSKYKKSIGYRDMMSIGPDSKLTHDDLCLLDTCEEEFEEWKSYIHVHDIMKANPTGIMREIEKFAYTNGRYYTENNTPFSNEQMQDVLKGRGDWMNHADHFKLDHDRHYIIAIVDNVNILSSEEKLSKQQTIERLSNDYLLKAKNKLSVIPVIVQQQNSQKEDKKFTNSGDVIEDRLEPDLANLGDCTTTQRDATIALSIYSPIKHEIHVHAGYNIDILKDYYRSVKILKDREGKSGKKIGLYFDGASDYFKSLPRANDTVMIESFYKALEKKIQN